MFVSLEQIKAARALLRWNQKELAQHAGLNDDQVHGFEAGRTRSLDVLEAIVAAIQSHGVEFTDGDGVRRKQIDVRTYRGRDGFRSFMDDVYHVAREIGGDIVLFNAKPSNWTKWLGEEWYQYHAKRMLDIKNNFTCRVTTDRNENLFIGRSFAEYRWFSQDVPNAKTFYCYGPNLGILNFTDDNLDITRIQQADVADAFRVLFNKAWDAETIIPSLGDNK